MYRCQHHINHCIIKTLNLYSQRTHWPGTQHVVVHRCNQLHQVHLYTSSPSMSSMKQTYGVSSQILTGRWINSRSTWDFDTNEIKLETRAFIAGKFFNLRLLVAVIVAHHSGVTCRGESQKTWFLHLRLQLSYFWPILSRYTYKSIPRILYADVSWFAHNMKAGCAEKKRELISKKGDF